RETRTWPKVLFADLDRQRVKIDACTATHGGGHGELTHVDTLGSSRTSLVQGIDQSSKVGLQLFNFERSTANGGVDDTGLVGTVLHLTCLGVLHRSGNVGGDGTNLGVGHQATGAEHLAEGTHDTHGVRRSDDHVEVQVAGLDAFGQVFHTDDVGTSCLGSFSLFALSEYGNAYALAGAGRQHDGATHELVGLTGVDTQLNGHVDGLIELGGGSFLHQAQSLGDRVQLGAINFGGNGGRALGQLRHVRLPRR